MVQVREVDPHDDAALPAWYDALHAGATADRTVPVFTTYAAMAYSLRNPGPTLRRLAVAAVDGPATVGALLFEVPLKEDLTTVAVEIDVPPPYRRRGVGSALWAWALDQANHEGRSAFQAEVNAPTGHTLATWPGGRFATGLGFVSENVEDHLVRHLPIDPAVLADLEASANAAAGYRIVSWSGPSPAQLVEAYADLQTGMSRDVPIGGMTLAAVVWDADRVRTNEARLDRNYLTSVSMALTQDGEPAGYTLAFVPRSEPEHAMQDDTYVLTAHRGHRLGTLLKVANARRLAEHAPAGEWLHTWTAQANGAMQRVNTRFGFRAVETLHEMEMTVRS